MHAHRIAPALFVCLVAAMLPAAARAATPLHTIRIAQGLSNPLFATSPPGDTARVFLVEKRGSDNRGRIKILKSGVLLPTPFLTTGHLATDTEQGLLGLAFAPDYATSGRFYVDYTDSIGTTTIARYTISANPDIANPTGTIILSIPQPYTNHNGGWIAFGPDGDLYIGMGDGGSAGDPQDRAQNPDSLYGKILRINVSGSGYTIPPGNPFAGPTRGRDEIWSYGLRNPWRMSFDRMTGDLVIGDVGQNTEEEIDFAPASAGTGAGLNYGWRCYEGTLPYTSSTTNFCASCTNPVCPMVTPAYEYDHSGGRCSVIGGYVYRGCAITDLQGTYFFGDYCTGQIYSGQFQNGILANVVERTADLAPGGGLTINRITSFGETAQGEILICDEDGEVYQIVPGAPVLEQDMPALRVRSALGDTLGSTGRGNALVTGITPFADLGGRIRGVGYLKDATIRDCAVLGAGCLTAHGGLDPFDIDLQACVDSAASKVTRRLVFTNRAAQSRALAYVDVITPTLRNDPDGAMRASAAGAGKSAVLVQYDSTLPNRWIVHSATASAGVSYSADVDTASELVSRIASDQSLAGGTSAGPASVGMALGFDFGTVAPAVPETVLVTTKLQATSPTGIESDASIGDGQVRFRISGAMPRSEAAVTIELPRAGNISLDVFDLAGRRVKTLIRGTIPAGVSEAVWDGTLERGGTAPSGVYFLRLRTESVTLNRRVVLLR